jgi:hypothetical protein
LANVFGVCFQRVRRGEGLRGLTGFLLIAFPAVSMGHLRAAIQLRIAAKRRSESEESLTVRIRGNFSQGTSRTKLAIPVKGFCLGDYHVRISRSSKSGEIRNGSAGVYVEDERAICGKAKAG